MKKMTMIKTDSSHLLELEDGEDLIFSEVYTRPKKMVKKAIISEISILVKCAVRCLPFRWAI